MGLTVNAVGEVESVGAAIVAPLSEAEEPQSAWSVTTRLNQNRSDES
jgi:hypothetical protein